jgi:ABC-type antimicrobial peptide transport system permease subunit
LLAKSVAAAIQITKPELSVSFISLSQQIDESLVQERLLALLAGSFGVLALVLASLGLYGITAYGVARRRTEIGIRMALGARPASVIRLVLSRIVGLVGVGLLAGAGISLWASHFAESLFFGVTSHDPPTLVGASLVLAAVAAIAAGIPAYRASRIDPAAVLRDA